METELTRLESGAVVVSQAMREVESVAFGLYFPTGSRDETPDNNGISHFIEHLVFKGTPTRSADEINREIDLLGGGSNAYTSKETLCFHGRVLAEHVPRLMALYGDLAAHALPAGLEREFEQERDVLLSEISAVEDAPEELVGDLCDRAFFGDHPLALPVVGSARAVRRLGLSEIRAHFGQHLVANQLVIAAAGKLEHRALVDLAREHLAALPSGTPPASAAPPRPRAESRLIQRDLEQVHVCLSAPGLSRSDPRRVAGDVLSVILGEGYSSRLFREVRDRRGLAYAIYTSPTSYSDSGSFNVYFGVRPDRFEESLEVVRRVLGEVVERGVAEEEVEAARQHLHDATLLAHESTGARMAFLADQVMLGSQHPEIGGLLEALAAVTRADVEALARELLRGPWAVAAVGAVTPAELPDAGWGAEG